MKKKSRNKEEKNQKGKPKRNDRLKATQFLNKLGKAGNETEVKPLEPVGRSQGTRQSARTTIIHEQRPADMRPRKESPEQIRLHLAAQKGDPVAVETIVRQNQVLLRSLARLPKFLGTDFDDLFQEGSLGLLIAIGKFNPESELSFASQAAHWIIGRMSRFAANKRHSVRLPLYKQQEMREIKKTIDQLKLKLNRNPTFQELAAATRFNLKKVEKLVELIDEEQETLTLDDELSIGDENHSTTLSDQAGDESYQIEMTARTQEAKRLARSLLRVLTEDQRRVMRLRIGLPNGAPMSHIEIGKRLGISRESSTRLEHRALNRLRKECNRRKINLKDFLDL